LQASGHSSWPTSDIQSGKYSLSIIGSNDIVYADSTIQSRAAGAHEYSDLPSLPEQNGATDCMARARFGKRFLGVLSLSDLSRDAANLINRHGTDWLVYLDPMCG
jgi:hypothetical protein